jgi:hypothetical protein
MKSLPVLLLYDIRRTGDWYVGIYVAFEDSGLLRYFPYINRDFYQSNSLRTDARGHCIRLTSFEPHLYRSLLSIDYTYTCVTDNSTRTGYDPRCRPWYQQAKTNGGITYSGPFASNGVMAITVSLPVYSSAGTFLGVVAADVTMSTIESTIRNTVISSTG